MKKYIYFFLAIILILGTNACDERFEEVNTNPNGISDVDPAHLFATAARNSFRNGISGYDYKIASQMAHFYVGVFVERYIDQYKQDLSGSTYEDLFGTVYESQLVYYNDIMRLTGPGAEKENEYQYAVADAMAVHSWSKLTDAYGDVPYFTGALGDEGDLSPEYDPQRDIYLDMLDRLKNDLEVLKTAGSSVGLINQDPVYDDNPELWRRFVNSLRFRLALRIRFVEPDIASAVITQCLADPMLDSNTQNAVQLGVDGDNSQLFSPWAGTFEYYNFRISHRVVNQLSSTNDPRLSIYAKPMSDGTYKGFVNGLVDVAFNDAIDEEHSYPGDYLVGRGAPVFLMTAAEVAFRKAEVALFELSGGDANELYRKGIELAMERVGVSEGDIETFLGTEAAQLSGTQEEQFEQICTQMWLAFAPNMAEAYSMMRRTGYPNIPIRDGVITDPGDTEGELPSRLIYPLTEKQRNEANVNEAIANLSGGDELKSRVWWDVRR